MTDIIDVAQAAEAMHIERSLLAQSRLASSVLRPVPTGFCLNPNCVEDFDGDMVRLFCGPSCADRFDAMNKHSNA